METNRLYFGDNLTVLREKIPDESVDLCYIDPPFNSARNYFVIFKDPTGATRAAVSTPGAVGTGGTIGRASTAGTGGFMALG